MSLLVTGTVERIVSRKAGNAGNEWDERTIVVQDWGQTLYCVVARDFGALPAEGESVALVVAVRTFVRKDQSSGHGFTALRRDELVEHKLHGSPAETVKSS